MVTAKTPTLKTVKSQDNCADRGTKTLTAGTLSLLRNLNGLEDKNAKDSVPCGVQSITISPGESWMLRATALEVLERTRDEIARNKRIAADTHADWLMDTGDSGPGAQWMAPDLHEKMQKKHVILCCLLTG